MENFSEKDIKILLKNLCCSKCRNDFTSDSLTIKEREGNILICSLKCNLCGKDFGDVVFNFNRKSKEHSPLNIIEGPLPITTDDVIDAHRFIKKMK